jgi:hypothetical protein
MAYVRASWLTLAGCGFVCWYGVASAQTFYKWSDEQGIVHFSDVPPANAKNVEQRNLPGAPPPANPEEEADKPAEAKTPGTSEGPARVVLVSRRTPHTGPTAVHVSGEVKNVGGADANGVSVTVTAVDITAGTPCLREEVGVTPSTLRPGETGNFDAEIDNPCLAGGTPVDVATSSE